MESNRTKSAFSTAILLSVIAIIVIVAATGVGFLLITTNHSSSSTNSASSSTSFATTSSQVLQNSSSSPLTISQTANSVSSSSTSSSMAAVSTSSSSSSSHSTSLASSSQSTIVAYRGSLIFSPSCFPLYSRGVRVTGSISPADTSGGVVTVHLWWSYHNQNQWYPLNDLVLGPSFTTDGNFTHMWNPPSVSYYDFEANWTLSGGDSVTAMTQNPLQVVAQGSTCS